MCGLGEWLVLPVVARLVVRLAVVLPTVQLVMPAACLAVVRYVAQSVVPASARVGLAVLGVTLMTFIVSPYNISR